MEEIEIFSQQWVGSFFNFLAYSYFGPNYRFCENVNINFVPVGFALALGLNNDNSIHIDTRFYPLDWNQGT